MNLTRTLSSILGISLLITSSYGASIVVTLDSGPKDLRNFTDTASLTGGSPNVDHDGAVVQLGYYTGATTGNPFAGQWVPLSGEGSAAFGGTDLNFRTTIGDLKANGPGDGQFATEVLFTDANPLSLQNLPAVGTPLSIRFYNGTSLATSTFFEAVSSTIPGWQWRAPGDPQPVSINLSFSDTNLRLQSTNSSPAVNDRIQTVILVPEPSSVFLTFAGCVGILARRRSRK